MSFKIKTIADQTIRLPRAITIVENELSGWEDILLTNSNFQGHVIGITGPPGAGKSTLVQCIAEQLVSHEKSVGIIAVDPSSPFSNGSLLGDRIRMEDLYLKPGVFIRSLSSRGTLGGLSAKAQEILHVMKLAQFDYIIVETVGVGQSETEVMGIVDTVTLVLVPEAGDEIQTIKSGIMEIADVFVVNKSDRQGADTFLGNIAELITEKRNSSTAWTPKVIKTNALKQEGVKSLLIHIDEHRSFSLKSNKDRAVFLQKSVVQIITKELVGKINTEEIYSQVLQLLNQQQNVNVFRIARDYLATRK